MEKNEEQKKTDMPGLTSVTTQSQGTGTNGIDVRTQSTFTRCGSISREKQALKIEYESFNEKHVAYISAAGIRSLIEPPNFPCDVEEVTEGIDGTIVISQVGRAWRSRSGRALVIRTTQSQGELMAVWSQFRKVLEGQVERARLSRFTPPEKIQPIAPGTPINAGLARGF